MTMSKERMQKVCGLSGLLVLSTAALGAATIAASEPKAWRFAHPEAQILAGVDLQRLAETEDGRQIRAQFVAALGAPLLEQAERMLLSSVVESSGKRSDVLILSGSFSLPQLRKMAMGEGAKMVPYKGLEIAAPAGAVAGDPHLAWITGPGGGTTVLIGTRPAIQAAGERSKASLESLASVNPLFGRALDLGSKFPVWVTCETVPQGFGPKTLDRFAEDNKGLDGGQMNGFDIGIQVDGTAVLSMRIWTTSDSTAEAVLKGLQGAVGGAEPFVLSSWLPQLKGSIEDSTLVLSTPIELGTVAERVGPMLAAFALPVDVKAAILKMEPDPPSGVHQVAPALVPAKKLFVRIEGMDGGVIDIPYSAKP
jgi:hypothetical protein